MAGEYIEFNNNSQPALNAIMPFGSDTIPDNWLLCNGQAISRTDYQELFNIIGITYGSGDGFTTFNLPDLQGKIPDIVQNYIIKAKQSAGVVATVIDGLSSTSTTDALSAKQGKVLNEKIQGTILYKNINGEQASSGITLGESVSNYDFIEIYCGKSIAQGLNCAKIDLSIANTVSVTNYVKLTAGEVQFITSELSVNGTSLTQISCQYLNISGERAHVGESTEMSVYEVIGYKY